ncbi:hypothetical protein B7019_0970 [Bifidobacterium breve JCM 7019]|nr:hypothetical protein B7019_0970 [Bifidobacterium breve JCM 7019]
MGTDMATNVTQKDEALQEVIDFCTNWANALYNDKEGNCYENFMQGDVLLRVICKCQSMLGYSGSMPSDVPRNATPEMLARWQEMEIALAERQMGGGR